MKNIFFTLVLFSVFIRLNGQKISWVNSGAGNDNLIFNESYSIISNNEAVYIAGWVSGNHTYILDTIVPYGSCSFLAKFDKKGNLIWFKEVERGGMRSVDLAFNSKNEIMLVGILDFGSYIVKYDDNGNLLWKKDILKNAVFPQAFSISIDHDDAILISGSYTSHSDTLMVEDSLIQGLTPSFHGFIIKYNDLGELQWFNTTSGGDFCTFRDIKVDSNNDLIVIGDFEADTNNKLIIDTSQISSMYEWGFPYYDVILAKYNSKGDFIWVKTFGGPEDDWGNKLCINSLNEYYIVGTFSDSAMIDTIKIVSNLYNSDIFLCKLTTDGKAIWAETAGGLLDDEGKSITTDLYGNIYISGSFKGTAVFGRDENEVIISSENVCTPATGYVAKYSKEGDLRWVKNFTGEMSLIGDIFILEPELFITGKYRPEAYFLGTTLPAPFPETTHFFLASIAEALSPTKIIENVNDITIYPNPTEGLVKLYTSSHEEISEISIYNINGKCLLTIKDFNIQSELNLSSLPNGIYLVKFLSKNDSSTKKIVISK